MARVVQRRRRVPPVVIGSVLLAIVGCGVGLWAAWARLFPDPSTQGLLAYKRRDWSTAARSAREILKTRAGDPDALRLLARSSVQMGRHDLAARALHAAPRSEGEPRPRTTCSGAWL